MGKNVFGVKWRNWKLHSEEQEGWNTVLQRCTMPRLYDLMDDPPERDALLFPHNWLPKAALGQLEVHVASLRPNPPIPARNPEPYRPKQKRAVIGVGGVSPTFQIASIAACK